MAIIKKPSNNSKGIIDNLTVQHWQEMYNVIMKKTDKLIKRTEDLNLYDINSIEELHVKLSHVFDTYHYVEKKESIKVIYNSKYQQDFSDFSMFKFKVCSISSAVNTIILEYNILLKHERTGNFSDYCIKIELFSLLAKCEAEEIPRFRWFRVSNFCSGKAIVEYSDYHIAQNLLNIVSEWFSSCKKIDSYNSYISKLQKHSHWIPVILRNSFLISYGILLFSLSSHISIDTTHLLQFLIISFISGIIGYEIFSRIGNTIENNIDAISEYNCINITNSDQELLAKYDKNNQKSFKRVTIYSVIGTLLQLSLPFIKLFFIK